MGILWESLLKRAKILKIRVLALFLYLICPKYARKIIHLEEHNEFRSPEEGHTYRSNGFYEASRINDFPLRDRRVALILRRRRWVDEQTGKSVGNKYNIVTEGTRHTVEFAAFLKETFGYVPDRSFIA